MIIHNKWVKTVAKDAYSFHDLDAIFSKLSEEGTFSFPITANGLFPASRLGERGSYSGYHRVWVRDNVFAALAHVALKRTDIAQKNIHALLAFFQKHQYRWVNIIHGDVDADDPMNRPHVRFDGEALLEISERWPHAQNDALGYLLWLTSRLAMKGEVTLGDDDWRMLGLFPLFFSAISFWADKDSGHWEEDRKVSASSIGVVVAGLQEMRALLKQYSIDSINAWGSPVTVPFIDDLIERGWEALRLMLPAESIEIGRERSEDAALLFLIYPLGLLGPGEAFPIVQGVEAKLKGDYGIRRYRGDSFWCANYDTLLNEALRTVDYSENIEARNALLVDGGEAQWCVFDPILSAIYGQLYNNTHEAEFLTKQSHYFNRSLGQLTDGEDGCGAFLCPELYYIKNNKFIPNDVTPLLWTQANLILAFESLRSSIIK